MHLLAIALLARVGEANGCPPAAGLLHAAFRSVACSCRLVPASPSGKCCSQLLLRRAPLVSNRDL